MTIDTVPMSLANVCNEVVTLFAPKASQRSLILDYNYDKQLSSYVEGDPVRFKQIFSNLISNAIKFTREGGRISINVRQSKNCDCDEFMARAEATEVTASMANYDDMTFCITVTDTGVGIKAESLNAIFDAYNQADKSTHRLYGGTGLGLSVCKSLVSMMGGHIWANSVVGEGTTFKVLLPLKLIEKEEYTAWQQANHIDIAPEWHYNGHILLVEDDNVNAMIAQKALRGSGHLVTHVTDGQKAIDEFTANPKRYDIILMDHHMPIMDGMQATIELHQRFDADSLPPIIALTANAMDGEREKYLQVGMQDYCSKPFKKEQLNALVQYWLMYKQSMNS